MKKILFLAILAVSSLGFYSCDDDSSSTPEPRTKSETVTMSANYIKDVYYSLKNGVVADVDRAEWDIAFGVDVRSSSILINEASGVELKEFPTDEGWQWVDAIDTTGYSTWDALYNGDEDWEDGAFSANSSEEDFNYGWGVYDFMVTHNINGVALYVIKLRNGEYKQIFIEQKQSVQQIYIFKFADLDGTNQQSITLDVSDSNANFVYYDLELNTRLDREPDASTWDLIFTKYMDNSINYSVSGILQNMGVEVIELDDVVDLTIETYVSTEFDDNISEIGYDWKPYNRTTGEYEVDSDRLYFIKDKSENVYKLVFTDFESNTGVFSFEITDLSL
jgi:hypothetical protein